MIFENDTLKQSGLYKKNNAIENETIFPDIINYYGVSVFMLKSLEKIRNNTNCEVLRNSIKNYLDDYVQSITEYHHLRSSQSSSLHCGFPIYAKTAYYKVLKDQENLKNLLNYMQSRSNDQM